MSQWESDKVATFCAAVFGVGGLFVGMNRPTPYLQFFGVAYAVGTLSAIKQIRGNVGEYEEPNKMAGYRQASIITVAATPVLYREWKLFRHTRWQSALALGINTASFAYHTYWWMEI